MNEETIRDPDQALGRDIRGAEVVDVPYGRAHKRDGTNSRLNEKLGLSQTVFHAAVEGQPLSGRTACSHYGLRGVLRGGLS